MGLKRQSQELKEQLRDQKKILAWVRTFLLVTTTMITLVLSMGELDNLRANYQNSPTPVLSDSTSVEARAIAVKIKSNKDVAAQYMEQSQAFSSWSVLLMAGVIGLITTIKVHRAPALSWGFISFGPGSVLLTVSTYAGWVLHTRYTYLIGRNEFEDTKSMMYLLIFQKDLFFYAIFCVSAFAAMLLVMIVYGKVKPYEN